MVIAVVTGTNETGIYSLNRDSIMNLFGKVLEVKAFRANFDDSKRSPCTVCINGEQNRKYFNSNEQHWANELLKFLHSDIWGPIRDASWSGTNIFILDHSSLAFMHFLKKRKWFESLNIYA